MLSQINDVQAFAPFWLEMLRKMGLRSGHCPTMKDLDEYLQRVSRVHHVCIVGSNPSQASVDNTPFHEGTKSRKTIDSWFEPDEEVFYLKFMNVVNYKKVDNKALTTKEIKDAVPEIRNRFSELAAGKFKLVTVGKAAHTALTLADVNHFEMPHPSGLCRFWNDPIAAEAKIKEMLEWVKN